MAHHFYIRLREGYLMKTSMILAAGLMMLVGSAAQATLITTDQDNDSGRVTAAGTVITNPFHRHINVTLEVGSVVIFELPTLPVGEEITDANYNDYVGRAFSTSGPAVDLYAIRTDNSTTMLATDYGGGTLIQDTIFDHASIGGKGKPPTNAHIDTDAAGDAALATWLQAQYTGNVPNATYAFFGLKGQTYSSGVNAYNLTNGLTSEPAQLSITSEVASVPEPSGFLLLGAAGALTLGFRKMRK